MDAVMFYLAGAVTLLGAVLVLVLKNPIRSAMALILSLGGLALVYVLLHAQFVAAMQLLVYAGAILVLFVFVIMLLNLDNPQGKMRGWPWVLGTFVLVFGLSAVLARTLGLQNATFSKSGGAVVNALPADFGSVEQVGMQILTDFVLPFEMLSVLLLVAVVGAVVISKKRL